MERNGSNGHAARDTRFDEDANETASGTSHGGAKAKDGTPTKTASPATGTDSNKSPRKRRKVNHGMLCSAAKNLLIPLIHQLVLCGGRIAVLMG